MKIKHLTPNSTSSITTTRAASLAPQWALNPVDISQTAQPLRSHSRWLRGLSILLAASMSWNSTLAFSQNKNTAAFRQNGSSRTRPLWVALATASHLNYAAQVKMSPHAWSVIDYTLGRSAASEEQKTELLRRYILANDSFVNNDDDPQSARAFKQVTDMAFQAIWPPENSHLISQAFLRLSQLTNDAGEQQQLIAAAADFDPFFELPRDVFPPPVQMAFDDYRQHSSWLKLKWADPKLYAVVVNNHVQRVNPGAGGFKVPTDSKFRLSLVRLDASAQHFVGTHSELASFVPKWRSWLESECEIESWDQHSVQIHIMGRTTSCSGVTPTAGPMRDQLPEKRAVFADHKNSIQPTHVVTQEPKVAAAAEPSSDQLALKDLQPVGANGGGPMDANQGGWAELSTQPPAPKPWYKNKWVWLGVGAVAVGTVIYLDYERRNSRPIYVRDAAPAFSF